MARLFVELKVFDTDGSYKADWTDVTADALVSGLGDITQKLDKDSYNVGVLRNSTLSVSLSNESGKYSDVGETNSIFNYTRNNSLVRVSWNLNNQDTICGIAICGEETPQNDNVVLYTGLLNDDSMSTNIRDQVAKFKALGRESLLSQVETPFASLSVGDTFEEILYTCLNQSRITDVLTVATGNIDVGTDQTVDVISDWENTTIKEVIDDVLEASGSVLYIENDTIYVKGRTQSPASSLTFYGQGSNDGLENIQNLTNIRTGINKTWNYWTWADTTLVSSDSSSVAKNGVKKQEIGYDFITNNTKRDAILDYSLAEFKDLKEELEITVLANEDTLTLQILEGCNIDYPTVFKTIEGEDIPIYGVAVYGSAIYPVGEWAKAISSSTVWKVMGKKYRLKNNLVTFYLREI